MFVVLGVFQSKTYSILIIVFGSDFSEHDSSMMENVWKLSSLDTYSQTPATGMTAMACRIPSTRPQHPHTG